MQIKYSNHFLGKLEDVLAETDYVLRYEKGAFKSGYCILKDTKVIVVNKYFTTEGKVNCLIEIILSLELDLSAISDKNKRLVSELSQTTLNL